MKNDVSRNASKTLSDIDEALRGNDDLHWSDPEFLEWERAQVLDEPPDTQVTDMGVVFALYHQPFTASGEVYHRPMMDLIYDDINHHRWEACNASRVRDSEYPPPEQTVYGPLMLGPEPKKVLEPDFMAPQPPHTVAMAPQGTSVVDWDRLHWEDIGYL